MDERVRNHKGLVEKLKEAVLRSKELREKSRTLREASEPKQSTNSRRLQPDFRP